MTKKSISRLLQASLMCCLAVLFTACEEFGMESNPTPSYLSLNTDDVTLKVGDTYVRKAIVACTAVVIYSSSNEAVATVDQAGKVTAVGEGTATITAQATGYDAAGKKIYQPASVSYQVTITPATVPATSLTLNKTMEVLAKNGDALTITATATPAEATLTWESSDEAVATVADGVVTPVGNGIATITAKSGDVKATCQVFVGNEVALSAAAYEAKNYDILKGNMGAKSLTIPDGFKVALDGVTINGNQIVCSGDATIYLTDGSENKVTAPDDYAGIKIGGTGKTLTINAETLGTGTLTAKGGGGSAGIGTNVSSSSWETGGNIVINGGTVTATGGHSGAGIGTGCDSNGNTCGDITINGGTVTATGGIMGAGIGTGAGSSSTTCGDITIGTGVTKVTATKGDGSPNSIGIGDGSPLTPTCGTITIGGVVKAQSDFTGATYTYTPSN